METRSSTQKTPEGDFRGGISDVSTKVQTLWVIAQTHTRGTNTLKGIIYKGCVIELNIFHH